MHRKGMDRKVERLALGASAALLLAAGHLMAQEAAYADEHAQALVAMVRARLATNDRLLIGYHATVKERASVSVRGPGRDHLVYRREMAARLSWRRGGPNQVVLLGAREHRPGLRGSTAVIGNAAAEALDLAFTPEAPRTILGLGSFQFGPHPLVDADTILYRFASGDTLELRLQDGRTVRLYELRVEPVRGTFPAVSGSIWVDAATNSIVKEVYRPLASPLSDMPGGPAGGVRVPGIGRVDLHFERIVIDHALWEMRWWLPRVFTFEGTLRAGRVLRAPFRYERVYGDYALEAQGEDEALAGDLAAPERRPRWGVTLPADPATLLRGPDLPASILDPVGPAPAASAELRLASTVLERADPHLRPPGLELDVATLDLLRFNRVEGFSGGVRVRYQTGLAGAEVALRGSTGGGWPDIVVAAEPLQARLPLRAAGYRRLAAMQMDDDPLGLVGTLNALLLGYDVGDYYRAWGAEVGSAAAGAPARFRWRVYAERQEPVHTHTAWSVPRIFLAPREARPNTSAAPATHFGVRADLRATKAGTPVRPWWSIQAHAAAEAGDHDFVRGAVTVRGWVPLAGPVVVGAEAAGGIAAGDPPPQALWYLGGPATLRGYEGGALRGEAFWRARGELSLASPLARAVLFADAGWAGSRDELPKPEHLASAGVGLSLFDGLVRVDAARPLRRPGGWRVTLGAGHGL